MVSSAALSVTISAVSPPTGYVIQGATVGTYAGQPAFFVASTDLVDVKNPDGTVFPQTLAGAAKLTGRIVISSITLQANGAVSNPPSDLAAISGQYYGSKSTDKIYQEIGAIGYNPDGSPIYGFVPATVTIGSSTFSSYSQLLAYVPPSPTPTSTVLPPADTIWVSSNWPSIGSQIVEGTPGLTKLFPNGSYYTPNVSQPPPSSISGIGTVTWIENTTDPNASVYESKEEFPFSVVTGPANIAPGGGYLYGFTLDTGTGLYFLSYGSWIQNGVETVRCLDSNGNPVYSAKLCAGL